MRHKNPIFKPVSASSLCDNPHMLGPRTLAAAVLAALVALAPVAVAAPTAKEKADAKQLWTKGKQASVRKKHDEAAASFRAANDLDPKAQYQLDLGRALVETGALVEAEEVLSGVVDTTEPNTQKAKAVAKKLVSDLGARIPTLKIVVRGPDAAKASVKVDGNAAQTDKDLRFDPGSHEIQASTPAGGEASQSITLAEKENKTVTLTLSPPKVVETPKAEESGSGGNMIPAAISYAVGGVGLGVGAVLGVLAFQKTSETEELCGGKVCPQEYADEVGTAQDYGTGSTVAFAIGGLGVAAGLILTFTVGMSGDSPEADAEKKEAHVEPVVGPGYVGVQGVF